MASILTRTAYRLSQSARVAWFGGHHILANRIGKRTAFAQKGVEVENEYPNRDRFLGEMRALFERDWANIEAGLYAAPSALDRGAFKALEQSAAFLRDLPQVARRRRDHVHDEVLSEEAREKFPRYYLQNFHYQSGGWLTEDSAKLYDFQVETLFGGTADAMRRQALVPIAEFMKGRDQRRVNVLDVATGTGRFPSFVKDNWPKIRMSVLDLSPAYLGEAKKALKPWRDVTFLEANAETMPLADASQDIVTAIYLFHELPPKVRAIVANEIARVLKPGGLFILVDSIQPGDTPGFEALTEFFPQAFHEPYFESYLDWEIRAGLEQAGLAMKSSTPAFLSKIAAFSRGN
ncbi:MAG: methyltransferase domain-containing protein [Micropepsaceae bacterium]